MVYSSSRRAQFGEDILTESSGGKFKALKKGMQEDKQL